MKITRGSFDEVGQDDLETLLSHAPRYAPSAGFAERVIAAIHEEEGAASTAARRPWYLRPYSWGSAAAAACLTASLSLLTVLETPSPQQPDALALDDALLVEAALDSIDDPDLVSAICCVSSGSYSIASGSGLLP